MLIRSVEQSPLNDKEKLINFQNLRLLACDLDHRMIHFYFNEQILCDYLKDMKLKHFDDIVTVIKNYGMYFLGQLIHNDGSFPCHNFPEIGFSIDVPYKKYGYAFIVTIANDDKIQISCSYDYDKFVIINEYQYLSHSEKKEKNPEIEKVMQLFRLAINIIFYVEHYPELVLDGVPNQLESTATEREETSFQVVTCEIFKEVENLKRQGYIVKPHARSGYWKVLRSDFYTPEKRGSSIHVSPTMVKGNSSTVLTHENIKNGNGLH